MTADRSDTPFSPTGITVIQPSSGWVPLKLHELWAYNELLYFLIWSDIKVRYKQTVLGAGWAILQPFATMVVFSIFFGRLAGLPSDGTPYPVFAYVALIPWTYFANSLVTATNSLQNRQHLITKVYFPRLVLPISAVISALVDLAIALSVLIILLLVYGIVPGIGVLTLPLFVVFAAMAALSVSLWLAALNVQYRDVRYVVPFVVQLWLFITPVAYPSSMVPEPWRAFYGLNPMAGVVDGFRWALLGETQMDWMVLVVSVLMVVLLLAGGLYYFRRMERSFVDVV